MTRTDKIRKLCDLIDKENKPKTYKEMQTDYVTMRVTNDLKHKLIKLAIKQNKPVAVVCREIIEREIYGKTSNN